jgi:sec-independent protein translocase protein TatA
MPGFIGVPELILLGVLALVLFGPKRLPEMGRGLGKGMREFKDSISGDHERAELHTLPLEGDPVYPSSLPTGTTLPDRPGEKVA